MNFNMTSDMYIHHGLRQRVAMLHWHDVVNINLSHKPEWLYNKVKSGNIPALEVENGEVLTESSIIIDYLDEKYSNNPLYPRDPLQKAKDRLLINHFNKVISAMYNALLNTGKGYLEDHQNIITNGLATFEKELSSRGGPFFGGNKPGMLDYMIWPWCERVDLLKFFGRQFLLKKDNYKKLVRVFQNYIIMMSIVSIQLST
ncbi:hypothetical protein ILUMI_09929 [Ignelater luminosus]|uniref:Uncharacterized protein n=1 Tax=Ignelater luminosus TaxID=2038154 RepID=A0A8K0D853_IGNLU|nr:hypothetical protein ILUMI_09929 [Ignelater luminosus]